jgi:hypothetical protein
MKSEGKNLKNSEDNASTDTEMGNLNVEDIQINKPKIGCTITTDYPKSNLNVGDVIDLPESTYYYSVNSDLININGWKLGNTFKGKFLGIKDNPNKPKYPYTKFELIK